MNRGRFLSRRRPDVTVTVYGISFFFFCIFYFLVAVFGYVTAGVPRVVLSRRETFTDAARLSEGSTGMFEASLCYTYLRQTKSE